MLRSLLVRLTSELLSESSASWQNPLSAGRDGLRKRVFFADPSFPFGIFISADSTPNGSLRVPFDRHTRLELVLRGFLWIVR